MPGVAVAVAVWISLHACLIHAFGFVYFTFTFRETRQNPGTAPINVKIIQRNNTKSSQCSN